MQLKRLISTGIAILIALSLTSAFAIENTTEETVADVSVIEQTEKNTVDITSTEKLTDTDTEHNHEEHLASAEKLTSNGLFYITLEKSPIMSGYKIEPDVTLTLTSAKGTDTVTIDKQYFNEMGESYTIPFNIGTFSSGDTISISFTSSNIDAITGISNGISNEVFDVNKTTDLVLNTCDMGYSTDDDNWVSDITLLGTQEAPLIFMMSPMGTDSVTFILKDEQGNTLPNRRIRLSSPTGKRNKDYTSDASGQVVVPIDTFDSGVYVHSLDKDFSIVTEDDDNEYSISQWIGGARHTITLRDNTKVKDTSKGMDTTINLNLEQTFLFDINKVLSLKLSNEEDTFTFDDLQLGSNKISLSEGTYNIESGTDYFTLTGDTNISSGGTANINLISKYFLKVASNTSSSNVCKEFEVINIPSLEGRVFSADTEYAVVPGQSLMLKDTITGKTSTVSIEEGNYLTELNIFSGETTVSGEPDGRTTPHTADMTNTLLIILGIIILALIIFLILYFKRIKPLSKKKGTKILSLLLVGVFTATAVSSTHLTAYAGFTQGVTGAGGGSSTGIADRLQAWNDPSDSNEGAMVKLSLAINNKEEGIYVAENSTNDELAPPNKFWFDESAIYIPTDAKNFVRAANGGIFAYRYDDKAKKSDVVTTYGKRYWAPNEEAVNSNEYYCRLLPIDWTNRPTMEADGRYVDGGERPQDYFIKFCINAFYDKKLYKPYGDALAEYCYGDAAFGNEDTENKIIEGYLEYLKNYGLCSDEDIAMFSNAYAEGNLVLVVQNMLGFYHSSSETGYYATVSDLAYFHKWVVNNKTGDRSPEYESYLFNCEDSYNPYYASCSQKNGCSYGDSCSATKHLFYSAVQPLMNKYLHTLKPNSMLIELVGSEKKNPFGGWGFLTLGEGNLPHRVIYPGIFGEINYTVVNQAGDVVDSFTENVADFALSDIGDHRLDLIDSKLDYMQIPSLVEHEGITYEADKEQEVTAKLYTTDKAGTVTYTINTTADPNNRDAVLSGTDSTNIDTTDLDETGWSYNIATNLNELKNQLAKYLGNDENEGLYYTTDENSTEHGNVKVVFDVVLKALPQPVNGEATVPQWRIDRYFPDILTMFPSGTRRASAIVNLGVLEADRGCKKSYLTSDNGVRSRLNSPDLTGLPFISEAKVPRTFKVNNAEITAKIKHATNPKTSITMWGDLLAYKDSSVDDLTLPAWLKQGNADYKLNKKGFNTFKLNYSTGEEKIGGKDYVAVPTDLHFSWEPIRSITHWRGIFSHCRRHCHCDLTADATSFTKTDAVYGITVTFNCYNMSSKAAKDFNSSRAVDNGVTTFAKQSDKVLSIYGEVPMLFTDVLKNNSIKFVTTDKKIGIKPISYHSLVFSGTIEPSVTGSSVATDSRAVSKLNEMDIPEAQMIHKGSGTQSTYTINEGIITAKTYAIDVGTAYESYKNKWNSADGYSATAINETFLNDFSSASVDGTERTLSVFKGIENLCIGDQEYGNITKDVTATAPSTTVEEYAITVRAGEITSVSKVAGKARDVDTNWKTTYRELVDIIYDKMKLNREGVLSVFAYRDGDALDESTESKGAKKFSNLSRNMRENSDSIADGEGWYSEDSTVLSLYVFTTVFSVPSLTFSNKVPISISGIESPQDFSERYSKANEGNLKLDLKLSRG